MTSPAERSAPPMRMARAELIGLLATISMLVAIGIDLLLPAFGDVRADFGLGEDSNDTAYLVSIYFAGMALAPPFVGQLSDRLGRRPVLWGGIGLYVGCSIAALVMPSFVGLLAVRFLWGVGAGTGRTVALAITRDRFEGDDMARVMSLSQAVFMLGPIIAPVLSEGLLTVMPWRWLFAVAGLAGLAVFVWSLRLAESLAPASRRPIRLATTAEGVRAVLGHRATLGYVIALTFHSGAFLTFLASSELLVEEIYDREGLFAVTFSVMSIVTAAGSVANSRLVSTHGTAHMIRLQAVGVVALSVCFVASTVLGLGFVAAMVLLTALNALHTMLTPNATSMALQPMGERAGIAAGLVGSVTIGGGAALSALGASFLADSAVPLALVYLGFDGVALGAIAWASTTGRSAKLVLSRSTPGRVAR